MIGSTRKRILIALLFLAPNLIGFLVFTAGPIAFSLYMSLTDWALTRHNEFSTEPIRFIGLDNYTRLLWGDEAVFFWDYLGNTLFLMLGMPIAIAGSLALAILLGAKATPRTRRGRLRAGLVAGAVSALAVLAVWMLTWPGAPPEPGAALARMSSEIGLTDKSLYEVARLRSLGATLAAAVLGIVVTVGLVVGDVFFRTIFYLPTLLAGVAMFLFWKTLYRPQGGLINAALEPVLDALQALLTATPPFLWYALGVALWLAVLAWCARILLVGLQKLRFRDAGPAAFAARVAIVATLALSGFGIGWTIVQAPPTSMLPSGYEPLTAAQLTDAANQIADEAPSADRAELLLAASQLGDTSTPRDALRLFAAAGAPEGAARRAVFQRTSTVREGLTAGQGLRPPEWLLSRQWAKTALVIMGVWIAVGGSNMLLYLAGLSNIPPELYEAADIDGAGGWTRFIHVTWPQLAPTTFFIVVMSIIAGLQGGFEQALVMTEGKADTITLTYYLYNVAFTDRFELGLASAIAWVMFAMIFIVTVLNFRMGSQLTNE